MIRTCCPICGSSEKKELFERDFSGICAEGFLLDMLLKRGYSNVFGIEPSSQCVSYARENLHLDVVEGGLGNMQSLGKKKFDVIVLEQVHI